MTRTAKFTPGSPGVFFSSFYPEVLWMMLRRFQFEITLSSLILCGLVSLFFYF